MRIELELGKEVLGICVTFSPRVQEEQWIVWAVGTGQRWWDEVSVDGTLELRGARCGRRTGEQGAKPQPWNSWNSWKRQSKASGSQGGRGWGKWGG